MYWNLPLIDVSSIGKIIIKAWPPKPQNSLNKEKWKKMKGYSVLVGL